MPELPKHKLGRTGLQVTMLGYGAMELHGAPRGRDVTETQAETILHATLDAGINYIDTSLDCGVSAERIGRYIAGRRTRRSSQPLLRQGLAQPSGRLLELADGQLWGGFGRGCEDRSG